MGYARTLCPITDGIVAEVSCTTLPTGVPGVRITGMAEKPASEMRERARAALHAIGIPFPRTPVIVDVYSPEKIKDASILDVPAALVIGAACSNLVPPEALDGKLVYGRLSLAAQVRDGQAEHACHDTAYSLSYNDPKLRHIPCAGRNLAEVASMCSNPSASQSQYAEGET